MLRYGDFEYERTASGIRIDKYTGSASSVNIPAQINGIPVTSIGEDALYRILYNDIPYIITSITIPDSVTSIGKRAFGNCKSLTSITIPDSVTFIGDETFINCESLTNITIPDSVTSIGDCAFCGCRSLTSITIPDSVTSIGDGTFDVCESLTSITIPDSVTSIGKRAFSSCKSLTSITIPDSVTSIGDETFNWCESLTSITIPDSVTFIGNWAFMYCNSLTSIIIPDSVISIGDETFDRCESLTTIYFPRSLKNKLNFFCNNYETKIHYYNFPTNFFPKINRLQNASNLPDDIRTSVKQLETLLHFDKYTSAMNSQVSKILDDFITIQELQQKIETHPVINLITLVNDVSQKKITNALKYIQPFKVEISKIKLAAKQNLRVLTGEKPAAKRQTAPVTGKPQIDRRSRRRLTIPDPSIMASIIDVAKKMAAKQNLCTFTEEKPAAKRQTAPVTGKPQNTQSGSVTGAADSGGSQNNLPNKEFFFKNNSTGITIIKYNGSADSVNIPSQINGLPVTEIGNSAFFNCTALRSITIPDSVTSIGDCAFFYCTALRSIIIPDSVTSIGDFAFMCCNSLTTIYFPRALMGVNGRNNTLKNFRNAYKDEIHYY